MGLRTSINLCISVFLLVLILAGINLIATMHQVRYDFTRNDIFSLSDYTKNVLSRLDNSDIRLTFYCFFEEGDALKQEAEDLLSEYDRICSNIKLRCIDPTMEPGIAARFNVTEKRAVILSDRKTYRSALNLSELEYTRLILRYLEPTPKKIYFTSGHGEYEIDEKSESGYSYTLANAACQAYGYQVSKLLLFREPLIPKNASCLIIPGAKTRFTEAEMQAVKDYINRGGSILIMLEPPPCPSFNEILSLFGIQSGLSMLIDAESHLAKDELTPLQSSYISHHITRNLGMTFFPTARPLFTMKDNPAGSHPLILAQSSKSSWGEKDFNIIRFDLDVDTLGPMGMIAISTLELPGSKKSRLVALCDSDFCTDGCFTNYSNGMLFLGAVAWLTSNDELLEHIPQSPTPKLIVLPNKILKSVIISSIFTLPGLMIGLAIIAWLIRRSR